MAGPRDIKAGRAYVELNARDNLTRALKGIGNRFAAFGKVVAGVAVALGGLAVSGATAAVAAFTSMGSELADMAARTGVSVEALSAWKYAAEQTGSTLTEVEAAIRRMQRTIADAGAGSKEAVRGLSDLGLTFADLRDKSPEAQFKLITARIRDVEDATARAAAAQRVFGRGGTAMLPMIQDLETLTARAKMLGQVMTTEDAAAADTLGDSLDDLWKLVKGLAVTVGAALAPAVQRFADVAVEAGAGFANLVRNNRGSIQAWANSIANALVWVGGQFKRLAKGIDDTFDGALSALMGGDFATAGQLAVNSMKQAWLGLQSWFGDVFDGIGDALVASQLKAISTVKKAWVDAKAFFNSLTNAIGGGIVESGLNAEIANTKAQIARMEATGASEGVIKSLRRTLAKQEADLAYLQSSKGKFAAESTAETDADKAAIDAELRADLAALRQQSAKADQAEKERLGEEVQRLQAEAAQLRQQAAGARLGREVAAQNQMTDDAFAAFFDDGLTMPDEDEIGDAIGKATAKASGVAARGTFNAAAVQGLQTSDIDRQIADAAKQTARNTSDIARAARKGITVKA